MSESQPDGVLWFAGEVECVPMPTAIALTYTREGFAIAADGRERDGGKVITDSCQKIFLISDQNLALAYAFCGRVGWECDGGKTTVDLRPNIHNVLAQGSPVRHTNLLSYTTEFSEGVYGILRQLQSEQKLDPLPMKPLDRQGDAYVIFTMFVAGYVHGKPAWNFVPFMHQNQQLLKPAVKADYPLQKQPAIYGPKEISDRLFKYPDPKLSAYRVQRFHQEKEPALVDGIEAMKNYIRACCDPEIAKLDPEMCAGVGGHIQIATVTPEKGFSWIINPIAGA